MLEKRSEGQHLDLDDLMEIVFKYDSLSRLSGLAETDCVVLYRKGCDLGELAALLGEYSLRLFEEFEGEG